MKASRTRWRRIDLTERQARDFFDALTALLGSNETAREIANISGDGIGKTRMRRVLELRRRLIVAGINPRDRWPNE